MPSARDVAGCYVPRLMSGAPLGESDSYLLTQIDNVRVFYPASLHKKTDADCIRIRLKRFLFVKWLELESAKSVVI